MSISVFQNPFVTLRTALGWLPLVVLDLVLKEGLGIQVGKVGTASTVSEQYYEYTSI